MKKVLAILVAMMFMASVTGLCFAQAAPAKAPEKKEAAPAPEKKTYDKKAEPKKAEMKVPAKKKVPETAQKKDMNIKK